MTTYLRYVLLIIAMLIVAEPAWAGPASGDSAQATISLSVSIPPRDWQTSHDVVTDVHQATVDACLHTSSAFRSSLHDVLATCMQNTAQVSIEADDLRVLVAAI